jgi:hypothetical protein
LLSDRSGHTCNEDLRGWCVEKKFTSRKNEVFLVKTGEPGLEGKHHVYKKYSRPDRMHQEIAMLRLLTSKGVPVPQICGQGEDYILLEYLDGTLLLDRFCSLEDVHGSETTALADSTRRLITRLCCWFKAFHDALPDMNGRRLIMGDVNFRNFIVVNEKVYGIDLEECREGRIEEEVGSLCAFALTYTPSFTVWKMVTVQELLRVFTTEFNLDQELVIMEIKRRLLFLGRIRGTVNEMEAFLARRLLERYINSDHS